MNSTIAASSPAHPGEPCGWNPKFLCHSFKSPIVLSDGVVTSCTLDHRGRNRIGSIFEDDFDALIDRFGQQRLDAMAEPLSKPLCHACYTRLPRWREQQVPRTGWFTEAIGEQQRCDYRALFDPGSLVMNIELSSACNLRCTGCSLADPSFRFSRGTPNIDLDRLMAWMDGHVARIRHIRLYHMGETWLHPRWFEFCRFLREAHPGITLFTSTNGMPLDSEDKLHLVAASGIDHVMFSIHGATQASTQAYMGRAFRLEAALEAARRLAELRDPRSRRPYLSWKYLLFDWNDSDEEIGTAMRLCDEAGFDELHFSITSQPAPSRRYALNGPAWAALRRACADAWPRAADYQRTTPMTAIYPGRSRRAAAVHWNTSASQLLVPAPESGPVTVTVAPPPSGACELLSQARGLLERGHVLQAVRLLSEGIERLPRATAGLHKALGDALASSGRAADAVAEYEAALVLDPAPRTEHLHLGLARALQATGSHAQARTAYETALRLRESGSPGLYGEDVYLELRETCLALGQRTVAENAWRMWVESAWLADRRGRTIYCPIAKNACTFMKSALAMNSERRAAFVASGQDGHVFTRTRTNGLRLGELGLASDARYFSFVLLRDPFERLASAYGYTFVRPLRWRKIPDAPGQPIVTAIHLAQGREPDWQASVSFADFVRHIVTLPDARMDHHWRPQSAFFTDIRAFSHVGCVEHLPATLAELTAHRRWQFDFDAAPWRNALARAVLPPAPYATMPPAQLANLPGIPTAADLFTDELRERVAAHYAADIRLHAEAMDGGGPVYPTGGALTTHRRLVAHEGSAADRAEPPVEHTPRAPAGRTPAPAPQGGTQAERTLVAAADGRAGAPGTAQSPTTLGAALREAFSLQARGVVVRVRLLGGVYRDRFRVDGGSDAPEVPLTIESEPGAVAVISGAEDWSDPGDWTASGGRWTRAWSAIADPVPAPDDFGNPWLSVPELMLRRELVVVGGHRLRQVLSTSELEPGTFSVDDAAGRLVVHPPAGVELGAVQVEVARRHGLLELVGASHVTLRGLQFRHDAGACFAAAGSALRISGSRHVQVVDCLASFNNAGGVQVDGGSSDIHLERVVMNHNGSRGLLASRAERLQLQNCETSFNNWRGVWAGYYRRSPCGAKVWRSRDVVLSDHRALHNQATGLWIDEDNERVSIRRAQVLGNRRGIHVEAGDGPVEIADCAVVGNRQEPLPDAFRWAFGSGIAITHARGVTVRGCLLSGNDVAQLGVRDDRQSRRIRLQADAQAREFRTMDLHLQSNTFTADAHGDWLRLPDAAFDGGRCLASLRSHGNRFVGNGRPDAFVCTHRRDGPALRERLDLARWQTLTGQDMDSTVDGSPA